MPRRPSTTDKLDLGFELMEQLLILEQPLTDDQINRYIKMWMDDREKDWNEPNITIAICYLLDKVTMLSRCRMPVPMAVVEQVCMCSSTTTKRYNWAVLHPIRVKMMDRRIWKEIPLEKIPKFDNLMTKAVNHKLIKNEYPEEELFRLGYC